MSNTLVQLRIEDKLKQEASELFGKLGLDLPTAIRIFLKRLRGSRSDEGDSSKFGIKRTVRNEFRRNQRRNQRRNFASQSLVILVMLIFS